MQDFDGKVAIVTGAAGNLGRAVCQALLAQGARIAMIDLNAQSLESARAELPADGDTALFAANLIAPDSVADMVERVHAHFGQIDILANIAGGFTMGPPVHETEDKDWNFMLDLNARTVFNTCRAVIPHMLARGNGSIVNVSARAATEGKGHMAPYCASKAAVITLTESLAAEHKDTGINVNCILPGTVDTPQNREAMPNQDHSRWVPTAALADVILFLASDAARCVTGAAVPVYGRS
ncbi:MAG: SDR family NAD(P)-dependent oxidoreductase [Pseudomonadota bacterium]|nr:SDR family NAD(P)-dependent oxidoreductase [Pseudomonadota bacterium]